MAVQPQIGLRQQLIQRVTKTGGSGHQPVARVGAAQAGRKVRHHHRAAVKRRIQRRAQPVLAQQRLLAHRFGQKGFAVPGGVGLLQVKVGGPKCFIARLQLRGEPGFGVYQRVKVGPQRGADAAQRTSLRIAHRRLPDFALQPHHPQAFAGFAQARVGHVKVQRVVLMVAGHEQYRRGPAVAG